LFSSSRAATDAATRAATYAATYAATRDATYAATDAATSAATSAATYAATDAATDAATRAATRAQLPDGWAQAAANGIAGENKALAGLMLACARNWSRPYQGGNMWGQWGGAYLSACRDILGLQLPIHEKYKAWEESVIDAGGFRWMHAEFCIVSDYPEILKKDDRNRPHCEDGPSHKWRDNWSLWYWHGVRVTQQIVEAPQTLTPKQIEDEPNAEIRRVMLERFGWERFLKETNAEQIHQDDIGILYRKEIKNDVPLVMVRVINSTAEPDGTFKEYFLRVPANITTARGAIAWTFDKTADEYAPAMMT
jgi:hypothetical protein